MSIWSLSIVFADCMEKSRALLLSTSFFVNMAVIAGVRVIQKINNYREMCCKCKVFEMLMCSVFNKMKIMKKLFAK